MTCAFVPHVPPCDLMELSVDERHQSLEGALLALPPFEQQPGDFRGVVRNAPILAFWATGVRLIEVMATRIRRGPAQAGPHGRRRGFALFLLRGRRALHVHGKDESLAIAADDAAQLPG